MALPGTICRFGQVSLLYERPERSSDRAKSVQESTRRRRSSSTLHVQGCRTSSLKALLTQPASPAKPGMIPRPISSNKSETHPERIWDILGQATTDVVSPQQLGDGTLRAKYNRCGAPQLPDEVEWHSAQTASAALRLRRPAELRPIFVL